MQSDFGKLRLPQPLMRGVMSYDKPQQIELVLKGELDDLLKEKYGPPPYTGEQIKNSVDFTRAEVLEHVRAQGFPSGSYTRGTSPKDGPHLDTINGVWKIWNSEKGCTDLEFQSSDPEVAEEALMDLMIYLSGLTGPVHFTERFELSPLEWE